MSDRTLENLKDRAPRNTTVFSAKTVDGKRVRITMDDFGRDLPAWDKSGHAYEAFISRFSWEGRQIVSVVDLAIAELLSPVSQVRMMEDFANLEAAGIDPSSINLGRL
jgi:hypothetical protein